jgi:glycolate oxidase FAD binding subunit
MPDSTTANLFRSLLGPDAVRPATTADAIAGIQPQLVVEPANELQLASALRLANDEHLAVIPRGGGTKLDWGRSPARADIVLSTARLNKILEHAASDLTVSVEAGVTIRELQFALARRNQRLAIDVLWPKSATIGGILSTNDSGALRLRFGSLRDLIIGVTIALPDGTLASSGGKVVKNVAGYDLPKLVTGAFGTLGVITRANFRLHPLPQFARTFTALARDADEIQRWILAIQDSQLAHAALQARFIPGVAPQLDILFEGTEAGVAAQADRLKSLLTPSVSPLAAPPSPCAGALRQAMITESQPPVWNARQELYSAAKSQSSAGIPTDPQQQSCAVTKLSFFPTQIAETVARIHQPAGLPHLRPSLVLQATGLAALLLEGAPPQLHAALSNLRNHLENSGGSLFLAHHPADFPDFDPFGTSPDSLPVMQSLRNHFDPHRTLNPGRFLV